MTKCLECETSYQTGKKHLCKENSVNSVNIKNGREKGVNAYPPSEESTKSKLTATSHQSTYINSPMDVEVYIYIYI